jgi:GntR family transcriptional repressor for pyruvate dehydrogenase complex
MVSAIQALMLPIQQVPKSRIYQHIIEQIKALIRDKQIKEGERLATERELAQQFGVSRITIRQALTVLHEMGLINGRPGGGTFVSNIIRDKSLEPLSATLLTAKDLLNGRLEVRRIIEPEVTRLAAVRATARDIRELERIIALQKAKAKKNVPITDEDTLFHETIARLTKNDILIKLVQFLHVQLNVSRHRSLMVPRGNEDAIADHIRIYEAIQKKDSRAAHAAMVAHLKHVERLMSKAMKERKFRNVAS